MTDIIFFEYGKCEAEGYACPGSDCRECQELGFMGMHKKYCIPKAPSLREQFLKAWEEVEFGPDGFATVSPKRLLEGFAREGKVREIQELCPSSEDSSIRVTFVDGTTVYIGNPRQKHYPAFVP